MSRMQSLLGGQACLMLAGASGYWTVRPAADPELSFDTRVADFGEVEPGDTGQAGFELTNGYGTPLAIDQPTGSCSCVETTVEPGELAPGQAGRLRVTWKAGPVPGQDAREHVLLRYRTAGHEYATHVSVVATVVAPVTHSAAEVRFGPGRPDEQVVTFAARPGADPVRVDVAGVGRPDVQALVETDGRSVRLRVTPGGLGGPAATSLLVRLTAGRERWVSVPIVFEGP